MWPSGPRPTDRSWDIGTFQPGNETVLGETRETKRAE
jgi:hypothetical protein